MATYMEAIGKGFPTVQCHAIGDGSVYDNIVWDAGEPVPTQATLDAWIAANPGACDTVLGVTKYQFRKLFTFNERVAVDNAPTNTAIPAQYRAALYTMLKDLELSAQVELNNPDVAAGVQMLEQLGLIGVGRAAIILSNQPPL